MKKEENGMKSKGIRDYVLECFKAKAGPVTVNELIAFVSGMIQMNHPRQQVLNVLKSRNSFQNRVFIEIKLDLYDLVERVVNGNWYRHRLSAYEIENGALVFENEMRFVFDHFLVFEKNVSFHCPGKDITLDLKLSFEKDKQHMRNIYGFMEWYKDEKAESGDDVLIKITDFMKGKYEIILEKRLKRNESRISERNREAADVMAGLIKRSREDVIWLEVLLFRMSGLFPYKDKCPPDELITIAASDKRFVISEIFEKTPYITLANKMIARNRGLYQFKITLLDSEPAIWRRINILGCMNLGYFHSVLQLAMGWTNSHLHQFKKGKKLYSDPAFDVGENLIKTHNEWEYDIADILNKPGDKMVYEYDFGDGWLHEIIIENIKKDETDSSKRAECTAGENPCPPEDCGGISGYYDMLKILNAPKHEEHKETLEWYSNMPGPKVFDLHEVNSCIRKIRGVYPSIESLAEILEQRDDKQEVDKRILDTPSGGYH